MPSTPSQDNTDFDVESFNTDSSAANGSFHHGSQIIIPQDKHSTILPQSSARADQDLEALYSRHGGDDAGDRSRMQAFEDPSSNTYQGIDDTAKRMEDRRWQSPTPCAAGPLLMGSLLPGKHSEKFPEHSPLLHSAIPTYLTATCNSSCLLQDHRGALDKSKSGGEHGSTAARRSERSPGYFGKQNMGVPEDIEIYGNAWRQRPSRNRVLRRSLGLLARSLLAVGVLVVCVCHMTDLFGSTLTRKDLTGDPITRKAEEACLPLVAALCSSATHSEIASFMFDDPSEFQFLERAFEEDRSTAAYGHVRTLGEVRVRPAVDDLASNIRVDLEFHVSEPSLMDFIELQKSESTLSIKIPSDAADLQDPCLSIIATIWIPSGLPLRSMSIETRTLTIQYSPQLTSTTHNTSTISSSLPTTYSRQTIIRTTSGSIRGTYPLYDLLSLHTSSGSISVHITPHPASPSAPTEPAHFTATTSSGHIAAHYPIALPASSLPNRDYRVAVRTSSGAIQGTYLHGTDTSLVSSSGSVDATLAPYGTAASTIRTQTQSGSTELCVLDSLTAPGAPMRALSSEHRAASGSVRLRFPDAWEGGIEAETSSGSLGVDWDGVRVIRDGREGGGAWRRLVAVRGQGHGKIRFWSSSGGLELGGGG